YNRIAVMEERKEIEKGTVHYVFSALKQSYTKNLVRTDIQDEHHETIRKNMTYIPGSRLFQVDFTEVMNETINELIKKYDITVNVLYATLNEIKDDTIGHMIIQLTGYSINEAILYLQAKDVNAKELN